MRLFEWKLEIFPCYTSFLPLHCLASSLIFIHEYQQYNLCRSSFLILCVCSEVQCVPAWFDQRTAGSRHCLQTLAAVVHICCSGAQILIRYCIQCLSKKIAVHSGINTTERSLLEKIHSCTLLLESCIMSSYFESTISDCSDASILCTLWSH